MILNPSKCLVGVEYAGVWDDVETQGQKNGGDDESQIGRSHSLKNGSETASARRDDSGR